MQLIVDRIEDGVAVLEGEQSSFGLPVAWLPSGIREGALLRVEVRRDTEAANLTLTIDVDAQQAREQELLEIRDSIPLGPGGDITLR